LRHLLEDLENARKRDAFSLFCDDTRLREPSYRAFAHYGSGGAMNQPVTRARAPFKVVVTVGLLLLAAASVNAQEPFTDVQHILRPGDTVFITDDTNTETRGTVAGVGPSAVRINVNGSEREWPATKVWRLERRGDSVKDGAKRGVISGAIVGGVLGVIAGATWANSGSGSTPLGGGLGLGLVGAGFGLGIGVGMDALIPGRTLVYQR
jgi:hypothetical protein